MRQRRHRRIRLKDVYHAGGAEKGTQLFVSDFASLSLDAFDDLIRSSVDLCNFTITTEVEE